MHSIVGFLIKNNVNSFVARTVCILKSCKYMNVPTSSMHTGWTLLLAVLGSETEVGGWARKTAAGSGCPDGQMGR